MVYEEGDFVVIRNDIECGKMYGDIEADNTHVKISGLVVGICRIRDTLYSEHYITHTGEFITDKMIECKA